MADHQYSSWVGLIYVFNLIVGTGALTLVAVFAAAGWLFSTILVVFMAVVGFITVTFVIETIASANALIRFELIQSHKIDESEAAGDVSSSELSANEETAMTSTRVSRRYFHLEHKVELGEMSKMFFNKTGQWIFYISLCLYLYGDLAIYAAAVPITMTNLICTAGNHTSNFSVPCWESYAMHKVQMYRIFVFIFAISVAPFSYFDVQKTKYLQIFTTALRWSAFLIMISLACGRIAKHDEIGHPPVINLYKLPGLVGSTVYSFMCHHSVPGLISPFKDKSNIFKQMGIDYILICLFYLLLALTGSFAFDKIQDLYTISFLPDDPAEAGIGYNMLMYFLGAFPAFTLSTSFPIIAITLQSNLKSLILDPEREYNFWVQRIAFPTLAVVPPLLVAFITHNLHTLVAITGSYVGVIIQYVIPATLVWCTRQRCQRALGNCANRFASPFQNVLWIWFVNIWAVICIIFVTVNLCIRPKT